MKYLLVLLLVLPSVLQAKEKEFVELQSRITKMHYDYKLNDDFTVETLSEFEMKVLSDEMAKRIKKRSFSHSTSIEKLEVLEAYTLKANGKKIKVPKDNYQVTVNKGKAGAAAIFSDYTSISIVFPDLEKNDSVYYRLKRTEKKPMFPGHFSVSNFYYNQTAYDDVQVRFDLPESLEFKYQARQMKEKSYVQDGRRIIELSYQNKKPVRSERQDFSVWDESKEAGFAISTFPDYKAIASAYAVRAIPKAIPTNRVKKLASKILNGEKNKYVQARLLYEWVATNISYAGNCIGVGAVVPHDTDFILDNRMGDCKDHATLLEALYRSVGIKSVQALINAKSVYRLPDIPLVTSVNHVINYLPEWDKYIDSTNPTMPFDRLAFKLLDKPVILVEGDNPVRRTPSMKPEETSQMLVSSMKIQPDGSIKGKIDVTLKGLPAADARNGWRNVTEEKEKEWLEQTFSSRNKVGFATIVKDDPEPLLSEFKYSIDFTRPDFIPPKGTGGFYVAPLMNTPQGVFHYIDFSNDEIHGYDVACGNGSATEKLIYEFPKGMKILAKPDNFSIDENYIEYSASYELEGNKLIVKREIKDNTPANICSANLINKQRQTLIKISDTLRSQVIYQY
jgi:transglutaminase-like putative cysteine protease